MVVPFGSGWMWLGRQSRLRRVLSPTLTFVPLPWSSLPSGVKQTSKKKEKEGKRALGVKKKKNGLWT